MDNQPLNLSSGITLWQYTGFRGHSPKGATVRMQAKKPKGKRLFNVLKKKTGKYPKSVSLLNMLLPILKDVASLNLTIQSC